MELDENVAARAMREVLAEFPQFEEYGPRLAWRPLFQGGAYYLEYDEQPPASLPGSWDFQNAVVRRYKALTGA